MFDQPRHVVGKWLPADEKTLRELVASRSPMIEKMIVLNRTYSSIESKITALKLGQHPHKSVDTTEFQREFTEMFTAGVAMVDIAAHFKIATCTAENYRQKYSLPKRRSHMSDVMLSPRPKRRGHSTGDIKRDCLFCRRQFETHSKFIRLCSPCKQTEAF